MIKIPLDRLNPGQRRLAASDTWRVLMAGGYGSGKTTGLAVKLLLLKAANGSAPGMLIAPTWRLMWAVTLRALWRMIRISLPRERWPRVRDRQGECYLDFGDGAPVFLRSASDPGKIDGHDIGWLCGDELRYWSAEAFEVAQGRVRVPCKLPQLAFASTPSMGWMSDEFNSGKTEHELITAPTKENLAHLAPGYITHLRQSYSPRLQRAVLDGVFTILEGSVYESFDPNAETSPWIVDYETRRTGFERYRHYLAVDPGFRRSAWIWIRELAPAQWIVIDQLMLDNTTDSDAVRAVNARGWPVDEIWIDPAAKAHQSTSGLDTLHFVKQIKTRTSEPVRLITHPLYRHIPYGVDKLRVILGNPHSKYQPLRLGFAKSVARAEAGKERGIIRDMGALRYPDDREGRPVVDVPVDDGVTSHSTDALRYFAIGRWLNDRVLKASEDNSRTASIGPGYKVA